MLKNLRFFAFSLLKRATPDKLIIFTVLVISLSGCGSISPLTMEREKAPDRVKFNDYLPDWQSYAGDCPGLYYAYARTVEPKLEFWAIKADLLPDLSAPSLRVVVSGKGGGEGKLPSTRVSSFVRDYDLVAGINATPFDPSSAKDGEERRCVGIVVADGVIIAPPVSGYDALVFYKDGSVAILPQAEIENLDAVENAVGGFRIVLL